MHRMAIRRLTFDIGCETGGGTQVVGRRNSRRQSQLHAATTQDGVQAQNFIGAMVYNRWWFDHDKFGVTVGGGFMANPGRYLVLLPPINGATAISGTPYFTQNPGQKFSATIIRSPSTGCLRSSLHGARSSPNAEPTFRTSSDRAASRPRAATTAARPASVCNDGTSSATGVCGDDGGLWTPDLKKQERRWTFALMVHL